MHFSVLRIPYHFWIWSILTTYVDLRNASKLFTPAGNEQVTGLEIDSLFNIYKHRQRYVLAKILGL